MLFWNLKCPKCGKRVKFKVEVCMCNASEVKLPFCENCREKMEVDTSGLKGRRRIN
ncbi:conserved hypothetical protein [Methanococcus vannielii SB]|uniref:Uncharacterized protein n=1 Tax=Methanococcus vannielii (strain ATCC 35089 / DSM 1224 / JCM 13029 / OCM 148 / SB) TaxID=406327 RepID=A6UQ35_METVS|nr:hypothetical protein [Methanococcus vannielii]ABR54607.1 conserved hypothetical protein [Methanococcus vannielii SB]